MTAMLMDPAVATEWPCAEVHETPSAYEVEIETPGFGADELAVEVEGHTLRVFGNPEHGHVGTAFDFIFTLPAATVLNGLRARFADGVLTVSAPLRQVTGRRTIEIERPRVVNGEASGV
jgi:HSP20 family molecular chaperone IbpA